MKTWLRIEALCRAALVAAALLGAGLPTNRVLARSMAEEPPPEILAADEIRYLRISSGGWPSKEYMNAINDALRMLTGVGIKVIALDAQSLNQPEATGSEDLRADLVLDWGRHLESMIADGHYAPLDELIATCAPRLAAYLETAPCGLGLGGSPIFGIPVLTPPALNYWIVRQDMLARLGIADAESTDDVVGLCHAARAAGEDCFICCPADTPLTILWARYDMDLIAVDALPGFLLFREAGDTVLHDMITEMPDALRGKIQVARSLYRQGALLTDEQFRRRTGKHIPPYLSPRCIASYFSDIWCASAGSSNDDPTTTCGRDLIRMFQRELDEKEPGAELQEVLIASSVSTYPQLQTPYYLCVPSLSQKKSLTLRFLDTLQQQEAFDLLYYGIEGTHWVSVDSDTYEPLHLLYHSPMDTRNPYFGLSTRLDFYRVDADEPDEYRKAFLDAKRTTAQDSIEGRIRHVSLSVDDIREEIAAIERRFYGTYLGVLRGELDMDANWPRLVDGAGPLLARIKESLQGQLDRSMGTGTDGQ